MIILSRLRYCPDTKAYAKRDKQKAYRNEKPSAA
jgi:hypothetical protein